MLIENAFHYLPEILCGSNYAAQEYEAGIVNAVSLAVLQELNARNVPNPLAALTVEKLYLKDGFERPDAVQKRRYLRADLYVDISRMFAATEALARFGWRHRNYLEAKFFRPGGAPSTTNAAILLADLIRLCVLTPPVVLGWNHKKNPKPSPCDGEPSANGEYKDICVGRYLLHVYEGDAESWVGKRRAWVKTLREAGNKSISLTLNEDKAETFKEALGTEIGGLKIEASVTNQVLSQNPSDGKVHYLCVLTRIDTFTITLGELSWSEKANREGVEGHPGDWKKLRATVGKHILFKTKGKSPGEEHAEETPPSENESEMEVPAFGADGGVPAEGNEVGVTGAVGEAAIPAEGE